MAVEASQLHGRAELWVQHSDRLARGPGNAPEAARHLAEFYFWASRQNIRVRSVLQDDMTFSSPLLATVMGDRNFEDSHRKSKAVTSGKERQFERGEHQGGPALDGYRRVIVEQSFGKPVKGWEKDPEREPIIDRLFADPRRYTAMPRSPAERRLQNAGPTTQGQSHSAHRVDADEFRTPRPIPSTTGSSRDFASRPMAKCKPSRAAQPTYAAPEELARVMDARSKRDLGAGRHTSGLDTAADPRFATRCRDW